MVRQTAEQIAAKRDAVTNALANHEGAVALAATHGVAFPNITSLGQFRDHVKTKCTNLSLNPTNPNDVHKAGAIIIQEIAVRMLQAYANKQESNTLDAKIKYTQRLSYFSSGDFITNFTVTFPTRDDGDETAVGNSYTRWFNDLFKVGFSDWRPGYLSKLKDPAQCKTAMGFTQTKKTEDFQDGTRQCYLCGLMMNRGEGSTIQCEHILPVVSALSHWWLIKRATYTDEELLWLQMEYAWSHQCCNMMKSNYDFLWYNPKAGKYDVNYVVIKSVLEDIRRGKVIPAKGPPPPGKRYDCGEIPGLDRIVIETRTQEIANTKIKPIVNVVNRNVTKLGGYQLYLLFIKFKVLSAITSNDFLTALMGEEAGVEIENESKKLKQAEAEAAAAKKEEERKAEAAEAAAAKKKRMKDDSKGAIERGARTTRAMAAMIGGNPVESGLYLENNDIVNQIATNLEKAAENPINELNDLPVPYNPETDPLEEEPDKWIFPGTFLKYIRKRLPVAITPKEEEYILKELKLPDPRSKLCDTELIQWLPYVLFHWDKSPAENVKDIDDAVISILKTATIMKRLKELEEAIVAAETAALRILEAKALGKKPIQGVSHRPTTQLGQTNSFSNIQKGTKIPKKQIMGTMGRTQKRSRFTPRVSAKYSAAATAQAPETMSVDTTKGVVGPPGTQKKKKPREQFREPLKLFPERMGPLRRLLAMSSRAKSGRTDSMNLKREIVNDNPLNPLNPLYQHRGPHEAGRRTRKLKKRL